MKNRLTLFFILFAYICTPVAASEIAAEGVKVERIDIEEMQMAPGSVFDANAVRSHLKTQVGVPFSQEDFDSDLKTLSEQFEKVEPSLQKMGDSLFLKLKIAVKPTIRQITWSGNQKVKLAALQKKLDVALYSAFDAQKFNQSFLKVKQYYVKEGFFEVQAEYEVVRIPESNQVDINISIQEGRSGHIQKIVMQGFEGEEKSEILKLINTKDYFPLTSWATGRGTYKEEMIEGDRLLILDYLQNRGFLNTTVNFKIEPIPNKKGIVLKIIADKGARFYFGDVSFEGNTLFTDAELEKIVPFKKGDPFSPELQRSTAQAIKDLYGRKGYIDAFSMPRTQTDLDTNTISLVFPISEGKQFRVGLIKIFGNKRTQDRVIRNETMPGLASGDIFNLPRLKKIEQRLLETDYFSQVNVYPVEPDKNSILSEDYRDVHIEVEEKNTGKLYLGMGVSSHEKLFGTIRVTEDNFNYKGIPHLFSDGLDAIRGGGENASIFTRISKMGQTYGLNWSKPYFNDTNWVVGFDITQSKLDSVNDKYKTRNFSFNLHAIYPINDFVFYRAHYRFSSPKIKLENPEKASFELRRDAKIKGRVSALGSSIIYNSTDSFYKPRKGFYSELMGEVAVKGVGSQQEFLHFSYSNKYYQPLTKKGTMIFGLDLEFVNPIHKTNYDSLAMSERLYLGGPMSVRGFEDQSIGPKYPVDPQAPNMEKEARGGLSSTLFKVEYRHELTEKLDGFLFFDAGYVSERTMKFPSYRHLSTSAGFGVNFEIFHRMPIILGFGFPIKKHPNQDVKKFFFTLGVTF